jgi:cytochrome c biogenesis protein CcmG/thiol:disulfide interchange protein DsbE
MRAATVLSMLVFSACTSFEQAKAAALIPVAERKTAPGFELKDSMGRTVKLSDYKGKIVILNFWATWCNPCKIEIPWFIEFEQKYKDQGFAVLGISMDEEGWEVVKPYLASAKINYRVAIGSDSVASLYGGVDSLPTSFLIDRQGRVAATHVGLVPKSAYQNDIDQLLGSRTSRVRAGLPAVVVGGK